jgi:hypothetical protein
VLLIGVGDPSQAVKQKQNDAFEVPGAESERPALSARG